MTKKKAKRTTKKATKKAGKKITKKVSAKSTSRKKTQNKSSASSAASREKRSRERAEMKSERAERREERRSSPSSGGFNLFKTLTSQLQDVTGASMDRVPVVGTLNALFGDSWLKSMYINPLDPGRLKAMAEAGEFLKESRELAGLTAEELANTIGMSSDELEGVESGKENLSMESIFRVASLVARHDPIPFVLKFMRTYNPAVESVIDKWGVPKHYERERRFLNLYRKKDNMRKLSDDEYLRLLDYLDSATDLILSVMQSEKEHTKEEKK